MTCTRLNVNINEECAVALRDLSRRKDTTVTDIIRRAISVYKYVEDQTAAGKTLQLADDHEIITLRLLP